MTSKNLFKYRVLSMAALAVSFIATNIALSESVVGIGLPGKT
jgi:hypothetical protein